MLATGAVILFAPDDELTYNSFAAAIGIPMTIILPIIAILSVTGEWSQRSGLTTFTLVPHRSRVITAKAWSRSGSASSRMPLALGIGALGNLLGTTIAGVDPVWDLTVADLLTIVLAQRARPAGRLHARRPDPELGRRDRGLLRLLVRAADAGHAARQLQEWFRDLQPWVDFNFAQSALFDGALTTEQWAPAGRDQRSPGSSARRPSASRW